MRNYKRKGKTPWPDKNKRMVAAVRKRAEGKSLREIAKDLGVNASTVLRDLRRWDEQHPNVLQMPVATRPAGGNVQRPDATAEDAAPKLRRVL